jgi:hypothetical protein
MALKQRACDGIYCPLVAQDRVKRQILLNKVIMRGFHKTRAFENVLNISTLWTLLVLYTSVTSFITHKPVIMKCRSTEKEEFGRSGRKQSCLFDIQKTMPRDIFL